MALTPLQRTVILQLAWERFQRGEQPKFLHPDMQLAEKYPPTAEQQARLDAAAKLAATKPMVEDLLRRAASQSNRSDE